MGKLESDERFSADQSVEKFFAINRSPTCKKKIADLQIIVERACKPGADQIVEMLVMFATANPSCGGQKFCHALPANVFSNAGMKNLNGAIIDFTANCPDAVAISTRFVA